MTWKNRIIGSGELPASDFLANPANWRIHPKPQQDALEGALNEIGWIQEVIVNQRTGNMIDGHLRVTLALRQGDDTPVPVKFVDLSEAEERLALATIDPIAAMAAADGQKLDELLHEVNTGEAGLQKMLAELAEQHGLLDERNGGADTEPQIDRADELRQKWGVETGQMWQLGEHRLICGDCTDKEVLKKLPAEFDTTILDPMYDDSSFSQIGVVGWAIEHSKTVLLFGEIVELYAIMKELPKPMYDYCWFMPGFGIPLSPRQPFRHHRTVVCWRGKVGKDFPHNGPLIEPLWDSIINAPRPGKRESRYQKNQTGIEIFCLAHADKNGYVLDLYMGSGTTLMACQKTCRICYGVEIQPGMVAVSLERFYEATGIKPQLC